MPATPDRIAFVREEFRSFVWSDPSVQSLYGKVARDTGATPVDTFFDDMSAVQAMALERGALLGRHARAFMTKVDELVDLDADFAMEDGLPGVRLVDDELAADLACAVVGIQSYDTGAEQTILASWGIIGPSGPVATPDNTYANSTVVRANHSNFAGSLASIEQQLNLIDGGASAATPDNTFANSTAVRANASAMSGQLAGIEQRLGGLGG